MKAKFESNCPFGRMFSSHSGQSMKDYLLNEQRRNFHQKKALQDQPLMGAATLGNFLRKLADYYL
jgi:hypothetical protein